MYENIIIDETSIYEIDEACQERCKEKEEEKQGTQSMELKILIL